MGDIVAALQVYGKATDYVVSAHLLDEVQWQWGTDFSSFTEADFLRESAWVILCSGFREATVRRVFDHISLCFCDWESAHSIVEAYPACGYAARASFSNGRKIAAIAEVAQRVYERGFSEMKASILLNPVAELSQLPYIGPITIWHLAKNLGLNVAKPDRHLMHVSAVLGFSEPNELCNVIAEISGDPIKVVDLVIWRYLADNPAQRRAIYTASNAEHEPPQAKRRLSGGGRARAVAAAVGRPRKRTTGAFAT